MKRIPAQSRTGIRFVTQVSSEQFAEIFRPSSKCPLQDQVYLLERICLDQLCETAEAALTDVDPDLFAFLFVFLMILVLKNFNVRAVIIYSLQFQA